MLIVAEMYRGQQFDAASRMAMKMIGGTLLSPDEHRDLLVSAGYTEIQVFVEPKGWICVTGRKSI